MASPLQPRNQTHCPAHRATPDPPSWEAHGQRHVGCGCSIPRYRVSLRDAAVQTDETLGSPSCNACGHPCCRQAHRLAAI